MESGKDGGHEAGVKSKDGRLERNEHSLAAHGASDPSNGMSSDGKIGHEVPISLNNKMCRSDLEDSVNDTSLGKLGPHNVANLWGNPLVEGDHGTVEYPRKHALPQTTKHKCGPRAGYHGLNPHLDLDSSRFSLGEAFEDSSVSTQLLGRSPEISMFVEGFAHAEVAVGREVALTALGEVFPAYFLNFFELR